MEQIPWGYPAVKLGEGKTSNFSTSLVGLSILAKFEAKNCATNLQSHSKLNSDYQ